MNISCIVDVASREVSFQENYRIAAYDHNVDVIHFLIEPIEDFSLDTSSIRIAAQGPDNVRHDYAVDPSTVQIEEETGYITFDWPIPAGVTEMPLDVFKYGDKGQLIFAVCAEIISGDTVSKAWHSDDGIITVVAHLEPEAGGGEDPEEEATNAQKIAQLQTDVAVIRTEVGALGNGSPTPVATVAEMTDESAVYLYMGSETGYTAGNWYYWSGSAWTSGGTYGTAVTDTTLSISGAPADAKAVGQALAEKADADDVGDLSQLETTAKDNLVAAINETFTELNGRLADAKSAIDFTSSSLLHIDHTGTYNYSDFVQGIRRANNHDFIENVGNRCTTGVVFTLLSGDAVSITNNVSEQEVCILTDSTGSGWKSGSFNYIVPTDGIYWAIVRNNDDSAIAPSYISATIGVAAQTLAVKASEKVDSITDRIKNIDGYYCLAPSNFEIGAIQISASGWNYPSNNTKRVRTKEGVTYHLSVGDVISLSDYTDARFYLGWKNENNEYKYAGWETEDYTVREAGDYVILLANVTEVDRTSIYALFNLLSIKTSNYALKSIDIDNAIMEQDAKRLDSFLYDRMCIPFTVNEAYISNTFKPNTNRISFDVPYPFNKGSKIDITVGTGEKFYMMYFRKVNNTGSKNTDYEYISGSGTGWQTTSKSYTATEDVYVYVTAAFTGDTRITKDTVNTKAVETKAYASADTDELPAYWKTYLQTKNGEINAAMDDIGGNGDAFVFYTDPHWGSKNQKHTPKIIQNMLENTALRSVYCGGDVIDGGSGGFSEYCKAFRGITVFTARGNHDQNPIATDPTDIVPDSEYYNRILKPIEYFVNTDGRLYYYRDNVSEKIRYIFMDSGSNRADTLDTTQLTWMQNALTELDSDWSALVIQHIVFTGAEASSTAPLNFAGQGTKTINAINAVWEQMRCTFIGIVCGHVHRDYATTDSTYGYPIIATSCDVGGTGRTQYDPVNGATPGTTDEHILDVFIIDKSNRTITVKRVGAGSDRSFTYPEHS